MGFYCFHLDPNVGVNSPWPSYTADLKTKTHWPTHEHVRSKCQCVTMNVILAPESPNTISPNLHPPYPGTCTVLFQHSVTLDIILTFKVHSAYIITRVLSFCEVLYIKRMLNCQITSNTTGIVFSVVPRGDFGQGETSHISHRELSRSSSSY
jgi:hypothetical protein